MPAKICYRPRNSYVCGVFKVTRVIHILFFFGILAGLTGCKAFFPNQMFKQKEYQFFDLAQKAVDEYLIQNGDQLTLRVYSRDGFKLIDQSSLTSDQSGSGNSGSSSTALKQNQETFIVDKEGFVKLPILGEYFVKGYTERQLESILAEKFSSLYVDPFISVKVQNRRAFVFKGSTAQVVYLNQYPTNIFEVIALSGGLDRDLKAYRIKLIRGDLKNPQITLLDLSTVEGMRKSDLIVQSNDIIYIERVRNAATALTTTVLPYLGIVSSLATLIFLGVRLGN